MTVGVRVAGIEEDQQLLIDTGSSSIAFCDSTVAQNQTAANKTEYAQCNEYSAKIECTGSGNPVNFNDSTCTTVDNHAPSGLNGTSCAGYNLYWTGALYTGDVEIYDSKFS